MKSNHLIEFLRSNRKDEEGELLRDVVVRAGSGDEPLENGLVGEFKGPGVTGEEHDVMFGRNVMAEYITISMKGKGVLQINGLRVLEAGMCY